MKHRRLVVAGAIVVNVLFATLAVAMSIDFYKKWDAGHIAPDFRLKYGDELLHLVNYEIYPTFAAIMISSAIVFWLLRK